MRTLVPLLAVALCACSSTAIREVPQSDPLVQRTIEFNKAFSTRDAETLQRLMDPEYTFHYIDQASNATLRAVPNAPRGRWAAGLLQKLNAVPMEWALIDARIVGNTGIVVSHYRWWGTFGGQSFRYDGHLTDVWVKRHGEWRILLSTSDLLPSVTGY